MRVAPQALALFLLMAGCQGSIEEPASSDLGTPGTSEDPTATPEVEEPLVLNNERLRLLPFSVRLARIAAVLGVAETDPLLEPLVRRSVDLGAPDYANGIQADPIWNAAKISIWADLLEPICASEQMRARYPSFPEALPELIERAYGRRITPEDATSLEPLATSTLDEPRRYALTCMTVLSAAEMVLQ